MPRQFHQLCGGGHSEDTCAARLIADKALPTVVIPAASSHSESATIRSVALTPLRGSPVGLQTIRYLSGEGVSRIRVAVPMDDELSSSILTSADVLASVDVVPCRTRGLLETLGVLLQDIDNNESILVVLGDTYVEFNQWNFVDCPCPIVFTHEVADPYRWCCVEYDPRDRRVQSVLNKVASLRGPAQACVGAYFFPDGGQLRELVQASTLAESPDRDLTPVLENLAADDCLRAEPVEAWLDAGHLDRVVVAANRIIGPRSFNRLVVDSTRGTLVKESRDSRKVQAEIDYLERLPPDVRVLFPRVLASDAGSDPAWYEMERYGYPSLRELYLWHQLEPGRWEAIFRHLYEVIHDVMGGYASPLSNEDQRYMYLTKNLERVDTLLATRQHSGLRARHIVVNGVQLANIQEIQGDLESAVEIILPRGRGQLIHGDLCFSNILYDIGSSTCRLVDPRGAFGNSSLYGDYRYDVAKLHHSLDGWYEHLAADQFTVHWRSSNAVDVRVAVTERQLRIGQEFSEVFLDGDDTTDIDLITGLTMCGIAVLHTESHERQQALYLRGLMLLNRFLGYEA